MAKRTLLFAEHQALKAHLTTFCGWALPMHYGSQLNEHNAVRENVGMFDVSHMTIVDCLGAGGRQFLRLILANDIDRLKQPGTALYSCMLNENGGIIDDCIVYYRSSDNYRLVFNAATHQRVLSWLQTHSDGAGVFVQERQELGIIAIQGPKAFEKVSQCTSPAQWDALSTLQPFESVDIDDLFMARTGYTGEEGVELILPNEKLPALWQALLAQGVHPCGLAARDSLRLEAGFMLSTQDMDETTSPFESELGWTVALSANERDFIGSGALRVQLDSGLKRQLVGLILSDKGMMRPGQVVILPNKQQGIITSGGYSPRRGVSIALARVPITDSSSCEVVIRDKPINAQIVKPRFLSQGE